MKCVCNRDNLRVKKITPTGTINYFYDGLSVVLETDENGNVLKHYNPGISTTEGGKKLFYLYNGHGDVAGMMDEHQNLVADYTYDAFGKALGVNKDANSYRYVGRFNVYSDDDIGLQYMWNRWYDPKLGRFVSRDPIGLSGGINLYRYSWNHPARFIDPFGLSSDELFSLSFEYTILMMNASYELLSLNSDFSISSSLSLEPEFSFTSGLIGADFNVHIPTGGTLIPESYSVYSAFLGPAGEFLSIGADHSGMNINIGLGLGTPVGGSYTPPPLNNIPSNGMTVYEQTQFWQEMGL